MAGARALKAEVQEESWFDRKHYAYLDLPQGYQITQKYHPVALGGRVVIRTGLAPHRRAGEVAEAAGVEGVAGVKRLAEGYYEKEIGIERVQIEQDSGKSHHDRHPMLSLVDDRHVPCGGSRY